MNNDKHPSTQTAIFAAGCFWGIEYKFANTPGVTNTMVGYTGGHKANPTYKQVCYFDTGHAEAVQVQFNPEHISYTELLQLFFNMHDATQLNRQGPDHGSQYRSAIFYLTDEQQQQAQEQIDQRQANTSKQIVTQLAEASTFWPAEEYHQQYVAKKQ